MKSKALRSTVIAVDIAAVAAFLTLPGRTFPAEFGPFAVLVALAVLGGGFAVRLSCLRFKLTAIYPFVLCALAALGPRPAVLVALAGVVGAAVLQWRGSMIRVAFNLGAALLSAAAASWLFVGMEARPGAGLVALFWPLFGATVVYVLVNTVLVAVVVSLEKRQGFLRTWKDSIVWSAASYSASLPLAACLLLLLDSLGTWSLVLGVVPAWMIVAFYKARRDLYQEKRLRMRLVGQLGAELERAVRDRRELGDLVLFCSRCHTLKLDAEARKRLDDHLVPGGEDDLAEQLCSECRMKLAPPVLA